MLIYQNYGNAGFRYAAILAILTFLRDYFHALGSPPDSNSYCDSYCEYGVELL